MSTPTPLGRSGNTTAGLAAAFPGLALDGELASSAAATACPLPGAPAPTACLHCGTPLTRDQRDGYCCEGCRAVRALLTAQGLERYYDLRNGAGSPVALPPARGRDLKWLEALEARVAGATHTTRVEMDLQGLSCAACVWLLEALFRRQPDARRVLINPALGKAELWVGPGFPLRAYVQDVERFGYLFGPALKQSAPRASGLLSRIGVCAFLAMNAMLFGIPLYLGLHEGVVYQVFRAVTFALATTSLLVGGSVFIASAWRGLRRGLLHLDVPIALGIVLAYAGSTYAFVAGRDGSAYFDTLTIFIALMLVGRWLQERVLDRNRRFLLASDGVDGLFARRVREGAVELVRCRELRAQDTVLVAPGDLVPVPAVLLDPPAASCSLDWITGESAPAPFARGDEVPAGAFNLGQSAITLRACTDFDGSPLVGLLRSTVSREADAARASPWWQRIARVYTAAVLFAAAAGFALWYLRTGDLPRALGVTTAILVVTCPCAFGIATPMAYELVQAGLRRAGLFVRANGFLDRAAAVSRVVFDKTGTLTTGVLALADAAPLAGLSPREREVLYNLAARSTHPRSAAVARALATDGEPPRFVAGLEVTERPGRGLEARFDGACYRLGAPGWASSEDESGASESGASADLVFGVDGATRATLTTREEVRPDAAREIARLGQAGYEVWVLSGDAPARVRALAGSLGVPAERAVGAQGPHDKAAWLAAHDRADTLMIGDGINDGPAAERAFCSGTPAIDRPFMPARTDFYFVSAGLRPVGLALRAARELARVNRRNLTVAVVYNAAAVGLCLAGLMSPLLCAVVMPATSLSILLGTVASLSPGRSLWTSS